MSCCGVMTVPGKLVLRYPAATPRLSWQPGRSTCRTGWSRRQMTRPGSFSRREARWSPGPSISPVGRLAVVTDPFGNDLVLLDPSKGRYITDDTKRVTGLASKPTADF